MRRWTLPTVWTCFSNLSIFWAVIFLRFLEHAKSWTKILVLHRGMKLARQPTRSGVIINVKYCPSHSRHWITYTKMTIARKITASRWTLLVHQVFLFCVSSLVGIFIDYLGNLENFIANLLGNLKIFQGRSHDVSNFLFKLSNFLFCAVHCDWLTKIIYQYCSSWHWTGS